MAKKNKKSAAAAAAAAAAGVPVTPAKQPVTEKKVKKDEEDEEEEDEVEEEIELLQVDVGDIIKVKQILDETVAGTMISDDISAHGETVRIREAYGHDNLKLFLMALACCFAAVAQFGLATDFPKNRILLGVCCASYFCLSGILQLIMTFMDKDCIMTMKPLTDPEAIKLVKKGGNKYLDKYGIRVRTQFPRFSEFYTVILEFHGKHPPSEYVKQTWSVGQFFDVGGYFDEEGLMLEVEKLYRRFEAGKYDKPSVVTGGGKSKEKKNN
jgi:signal peptidase complex subunit 2